MSDLSVLHKPLPKIAPMSVSATDSERNGNAVGGNASISTLETVDRLDISRSLVDEAERKTKEFSEFFIGILESEGIGLSDIRTLKDTFSITLKDGQLTVSGPYKEHIEGYLRDHPEVDKRVKDALKEVLALNALIALKEVNERYLQEKSKAEKIADPEKREEALKKADAQHLGRSNMLQSLSGTMTFRNGAFSSAALDYIRTLPA